VATPLLFLFFLALAQGKALFAGNVYSPVFLLSSDKLLVWGLFLFSFLYFARMVVATAPSASASSLLGAATLSLAYVSCPSSLLYQSEVASVQGGGLAMLPCLSQPRWLRTFTFAKALVCLCVVCFLV